MNKTKSVDITSRTRTKDRGVNALQWQANLQVVTDFAVLAQVQTAYFDLFADA